MTTQIPQGSVTQVLVDERPEIGEEYTIYVVVNSSDPLLNGDWAYVNGEWERVWASATQYNVYSNELVEQIKELENIVVEQSTLIAELEEAVFGVTTTFQMSVTSLTTTMLNLVNESGEVVVSDALQTRKWSFEDITYEATVPKGTYYLRNDEYAIGVSGEMLPLVVDGTKVVDLGTVKVIAVGGEK